MNAIAPLIWMVLKVSGVLAVALLVIVCLGNRTNPRWRLLVCRVTLVFVAIMPCSGLLPPSARLAVISSPAAKVESELIPVAGEETGQTNIDPESVELAASAIAHDFESPPKSRGELEAGADVIPWPAVIGAVYACVAFSFLLWMIRGIVRLRRVLRKLELAPEEMQRALRKVSSSMGHRARTRLLLSDSQDPPFACGLISSRIVVPRAMAEQLSSEELESTLRHELQHLKNHDLRWSAAFQFALAVWWIHPLLWLLRRSHSLAQEELSDRVAAEPGGVKPYTAFLARMALTFQNGPRCASAEAIGLFRNPQILGRLRRLRRCSPGFAPLPRFGAVSAVAAAAAIVFAVALLSFAAEPVVEAKSPGATKGMSKEERKQIRKSINRARSYLTMLQREDGSFGDSGYNASAGIIALAGANFIGADKKRFKKVHMQALDHILKHQAPNGYISSGKQGSNMYHHCIATWFLAKTRAHMEEDQRPRIDRSLDQAVALILEAQKVPKVEAARGGWRYVPTSKDSDISCSAWALRALYAANAAGRKVPDQALKDGLKYILGLQHPEDGSFAYTSAGRPKGNLTRTGIGLYFLIIGGADKSDPAVKRAVQFILDNAPKLDGQKPAPYMIYGNFWCADAMQMLGGKPWKTYRQWMFTHFLETQKENGSWEGDFSVPLSTSLMIHAFE